MYNNPYVPAYSQPTTAAMPSAQSMPSYYSQPMYSQQYSSPYPPQASGYSYANTVNNKNIIWVAGQAGAEAYQLEPGTRAVLLDSKDQVFYIKVVGADGRPEPLMAFKYEPLNFNIQGESSQSAPQVDMSNYATKEDIEEIMNYIKKMSSGSQSQKGMKNG